MSMGGDGEIVRRILQDVAEFVGDAKQYDDMTVILLKKA